MPGEVTFQFSIASTAAKIPTAPTAPTTPVGVSAYEYLEYETGESDPNGIVNELVTSLPPDVSTYLLNSDSLSGWSITESGTATATLSDGTHLQSGSVANNDAWVELTRVLEKPTGSFVIILEISCDSLGSWPSADYFVLNWWPIYHEKSMPYLHYGVSFWEDGIWKESEIPGISIHGVVPGTTQTWRFEYDYWSNITTAYMNNHPCGRFSAHSFSGTGVGEPEENNIYLTTLS